MSERLDLYAPIHKGLRNAMRSSLLRLGQLDPSDASDVRDALTQLRDLLAWMEDHLQIENEIVHEDHEREFAVLKREADALERAASESRAVQRARTAAVLELDEIRR